MKEQFCTYKIALALKELGFDEPCILYYNTKNKKFDMDYCDNLYVLNDMLPSNAQMLIAAPLWQQAWSFLNDKYGIFITIALVANGYGFYIHTMEEYTEEYTSEQVIYAPILQAIPLYGIRGVWNEVVEFIKWYNKQKENESE
jgi:hypothetical protein